LLVLLVVSRSPSARSEEPDSQVTLQDGETIIGPTSLADWFKDRTKEDTRDEFLKDFDLDLKSVAATLGDCKLYLIEKKETGARGEPVFAVGRDNGYPKSKLAGKQSFVVKNKDGKNVSITVGEAKFSRSSVDNSLATPQCKSIMSYELKARGPFKIGGVQIGEHSATWSFVVHLNYDISGKEIKPDKEKK
jgi:hypothetical protein